MVRILMKQTFSYAKSSFIANLCFNEIVIRDAVPSKNLRGPVKVSKSQKYFFHETPLPEKEAKKRAIGY